MHCPYCGEGPRLVEHVGGNEWFCNICGKSWKITPIDEIDARDRVVDVQGHLITGP